MFYVTAFGFVGRILFLDYIGLPVPLLDDLKLITKVPSFDYVTTWDQTWEDHAGLTGHINQSSSTHISLVGVVQTTCPSKTCLLLSSPHDMEVS